MAQNGSSWNRIATDVRFDTLVRQDCTGDSLVHNINCIYAITIKHNLKVCVLSILSHLVTPFSTTKYLGFALHETPCITSQIILQVIISKIPTVCSILSISLFIRGSKIHQHIIYIIHIKKEGLLNHLGILN